MLCEYVSLREELEAIGAGIVCLTGGGGKTSLLYALGTALAKAGSKVLCTTTTKMYHPNPSIQISVKLQNDPADLTLGGEKVMFAARKISPAGEAGKVFGYSAGEVDTLYERGTAPWIIVEADGAAGRPVKSPAEHEPVIPAGTAIVIGVIGLRCLSQPLTPELVFRAEHFSSVTGIAMGSLITPEALATLILHPDGLFKNSPHSSVRLLFCNQSDLPGALKAGKAIAEAVFSRDRIFLRSAYLGAVRTERLKCLKITPDKLV